jgi:hypothetical protein
MEQVTLDHSGGAGAVTLLAAVLDHSFIIPHGAVVVYQS